MEFWLLSLPLDKTSVASLEKLKRTIAKTNLATCGKLSIPELKVGKVFSLSPSIHLAANAVYSLCLSIYYIAANVIS